MSTPSNAIPPDAQPEESADCCVVPMTETDSMATMQTTDDRCPRCGQKGKQVDTLTVKALLGISLEIIRPAPYRFCETETCPVVYFAADGHLIEESALRERVHQKHPDADDVFVCYCFRHTPGGIRTELETTGTSTVIEHIRAGIRAGQCACEIRNPQGSCCLGNVTKVVRKLEKTLPT